MQRGRGNFRNNNQGQYNVSGRRGGFGSRGRRGGRGGSRGGHQGDTFLKKRRKDTKKPESSKRYIDLRTKVLNSSVKSNTRTKAIQEVIASIKNEGISKVVDTKDGSKLVQSCLKYSKHKTKNDIAMLIIEDDLIKICTSKYGQFIINKLVKYGISKKYINQMETIMIENYPSLLVNETARRMLHTHIESMNDFQILEFDAKVYEKNSTVDPAVLEFIDNNFELNLAPYQSYLKTPADVKVKTLEIMKQMFDAFIQNRFHGFLLFAKMFDSMKLKDRKKLLNDTIKGRIYELLSYNPNFFLLLVKVVCGYDDAKNMKEFVLNEVGEKFMEFVQEEDCIKFLNFLFSGVIDKAFMRRFNSENGKKAIEIFTHNTGKKPVEKKLEETYEYLLDEVDVTKNLIDGKFKENLLKKIQFCHLVSFFLKTAISRSSNQKFVKKFIKILIEDTKECMEDASFINIDETLITNPFTQRLSFDEADAEEKEELEKKIQPFIELILDNLNHVVKTKAVFIVLALIEHTSYSEKIKAKVRKLIKKGKIDINQEKKEVGLKILIKNVKNEEE